MDELDMAGELSPAQKYAMAVRRAKARCISSNPKIRALVAAQNADFKRLDLTPGAVHNNSTLASLSVQYANEEYIGVQLMPVASVAKLSDKFAIYDKRSRVGFPDDSMAARSDANELTDGRTFDTYSCQPYALKDFVDVLTLQNQDAPLNEMIDLVQLPSEGLEFRRELRIASVLTTSANFGSNTGAIAAGSQWNTGSGGNPVSDIQTAIAAIWMGRGPSELVGYTSLTVANVLQRHPAILDMYKYNKTGLVPLQGIADMFGLSKILVGKARKDTANEGQTASYSRVWSDVFGIVRVATAPNIRNASFGFTMRFGGVESSQWFDQSKGTRGGYYARVSTHEDHKIVASSTGYLITSPCG